MSCILRRARGVLGCALILGDLAACKGEPRRTGDAAGPASSEAPAAGAPALPPPGPWFAGSPEQAFAEARARGKLVFFYWGAAWCPPCNELRAEVFQRPRFAEIMQGFVPVYLDGDTEGAQRWGEALGASAYPTLLILGPDREELLRLNGSVDLRELEQALQAVSGRSQGFRAAVQRLEQGAAQPEDLRVLAHAAWAELPEEAYGRARCFTLLQQAVDLCPPDLGRERALLAAHLLTLAIAGRGSADLQPALRDLEARAPVLLDAAFADPEATWAARWFVVHRAGDMAAWLQPKGDAYEAWKRRWLAAAALVRDREDAPVELRLYAARPALDLFRHGSPEGPAPEALRAEVEAAVRRADEQARSPAERDAMLSGAAYLLRRIGAHDRARQMLLAAAQRSATPFYHYSSLSALEQELGRAAEARQWSAKARQVTGGRATRLQWITNDILLNARPESPEQRTYLLALAEEFHELATGLADGFSGRNRARAEQVREALGALRGEPLQKLAARYRERCDRLDGEGRESCRRHFEALR